MDIAALSETRFAGNGILQEKDYNFYWSGRSEEEARSAGVGFAIRRSIANDLVELPIALNERLMTLRIPLSKSNHVTLLSAYAPTMTSSDSAKERFYEDLSKVLKKIPNEDKIILLGDFNARVGNDIEAWPKVLGKHLLGKMNSNGLMLLSICSEFKLTITNSTFQQSDKYKGTWRHPRSKHWHTLDYVITRQRDLKDVHMTRAHRGTECWSDHRLVRSNIKISFARKPPRSKSKIPKKINCDKLKDPAVLKKFNEEMDKELQKCNLDENIEQSWNTFKETLYEKSVELLGFPKRRHQDWFDENDVETSLLINKMHQSHLKFMNAALNS